MKSAPWLLLSSFLAIAILPSGSSAQEMQSASLDAAPSPVFRMSSTDLEGKSFDLGVSAGYWFGGNVVIEGFDVDKDGAFLLRIFADSYLMPRFAFGGYFNFSPYSQEGVSITMFEFGAGIKPRFLLAPDFAIKPGLNIGYRFTTSDIDAAEISALGINVSVEFQKAMPGVFLFGEFGFLSQPSGGNADIEVTFAPIFYFTAGVGI
ncbi:MAG: hypothetical protein WEB33_02855 [Bacteroidota bacterium]